MPHHLYADDTQMLDKTTIQSLGTCCSDLETCNMAVQRWCAARRLQLIPDETDFICCEATVHMQYLGATSTGINTTGVDIKPVKYVRSLGVLMDSRLSMHVHISNICVNRLSLEKIASSASHS
jgi:hypothetical protein